MKFRNLALILILIFSTALVAIWYGSREFKVSLLKQEAVSDAVRWAVFVASQSRQIKAELSQGKISKETSDALELAASAGAVFRYKLFGPDGVIIHASRPADIGKLNTKPYFEELVKKGKTFAKIETDENFGKDRTVVSEAYVPLMEGERFAGAIEVYVDESAIDARLDRATNYAFLGLTFLMFLVAVSWAYFVWRDLQIRHRLEKELTHHRDHLQELVDKSTGELRLKAEELRMALGKEKEVNKMQRQFVSMASHEFRTPLAIIDATAQRMRKRASKNLLTPADASQRVEKIRGAVGRMTRLMESMLDAARMEEGKIKVEVEPCDVKSVVEGVCERQQELAQSHIISCKMDELPETIMADASALEQALTNLLSNAVKYAPDSPYIEVEAYKKGQQVMISVSDHGFGIDEEDLPNIGQRFFRAATSIGTVGTGIGLNLAKALMEMHDGTIEVKSEKGVGSTFTISLPVNGPESSSAEEASVA